MTSLLVVTSSYPYGHSEAFFTPELQALATRFDRIDLLPVKMTGADRRSVPEAVRALPPLLVGNGQDVINTFCAPHSLVPAVKQLFEPGRSRFDIANMARLRAAMARRLPDLRAQGYDLIYVYWGTPSNTLVPQLRRVAPCVERFHGTDLWGSSGGKALRPGTNDHIDLLERAYFVSDVGRRVMLQAAGSGSESRCHVRYLGSADMGRIQPQPYEAEVSILSCAFLTPNKRVDRTAQVVRRLSETRPVRWTHIGGGDAAAIEDLRSQAGSDAKVDFKGNVAHADIAMIFQDVRPNLLMSMSNSEGLAINVLEAMSAGVPVVSTDVGGMAEAVTDQVGLIVEKGYFDDADALAARIVQGISPGGALVDANPRSVWETRFDAGKNAEIFADELKALCDAKNSQAD